jgi:hypothetical protein
LETGKALTEAWQGGGRNIMTTTHQPGDEQTSQSPLFQRDLATGDLGAILAWSDNGDEAAGAWLCEKYRPLIMHIASRKFPGLETRQEIADESLRRALSTVGTDHRDGSAAGLFARVALEVCCERALAQGAALSDEVAKAD